MRLKLLLSLTFLSASIFSFAQKIGTWDVHFSYTGNIEQIVDAGNRLYVLTDGKLYSYFPDDDFLETYVRKDVGNPNILKIEYNEKNDALIAFRSNSDIDILHANGSFVTIPYLKNATQNIDKTLNNIYCVDDLAYLSTNFGILVLDVAREEIKEVGLFNKKFYSTCVFGDYLYATTEDGPKRILLTKNMLDINNWEEFDVISRCDDKIFVKASIVSAFMFNDKLSFFIRQSDDASQNLVEVKRIYSWNTETDKMELIDSYVPLGLIYVSNEKILANRWGTVWVINPGSTEYFNVPVKNYQPQAIIPKKGKTDEYWAGISGHYLSLIKRVEHSYEIIEDNKAPSGPGSNLPFSMTHEGGKLLVTGGGYYFNRYDSVATLSYYKNNKWTLFDKKLIDDKFGVNSRDFNSVITDPSNRDRIFVTSWGEGLYEFLNDEPVLLHTPENTGGILEDIHRGKYGSSFVRLGGMQFDKSGNLWMTNAQVPSQIKVLKKDGTWEKVTNSDIAWDDPDNASDAPTARGLMIDKYNKKWVYSMFSTPYLFILDDNGTPSNSLDDKTKYLTSFVDQDNKTVSISQFWDIKEDQTGNIWVATNTGPFVVYGTSNILNSNRSVVFNKIKIPRNDGTNNVDILLDGTTIKAIAIDGANRKWLGTPYGAYLVSANGLETIQYFNMDNSPLPSNEIISLAIDPENGTVYIGTDKGMVSYVSDAIEGKSDYSNVYAFPNPVRPDYQGLITVTGLQTNSNVKITDVRGNLLKQGLSLGGQYVWDGRNPSGKRVDTGVYLVFGVGEDGKSGVVTKILVVSE